MAREGHGSINKEMERDTDLLSATIVEKSGEKDDMTNCTFRRDLYRK